VPEPATGGEEDDMETISGFEAVARNKIDTVQQSLRIARQLDHPFEVHLHNARLLDLLERATLHAVDTAGWVDDAVLAAAVADCA
jgi:hypothetical protein